MSTANTLDPVISALRWLRSTIEELDVPQPKRRPIKETFGHRLARIRKTRSLSQRDLAVRLDISQRMVAYYESQTDHPPTHLLPQLAKVLSVSLDELLGTARLPSEPVDIDVRLLRRIQRIQRLPPGTKRAVLKVIDDLLANHLPADARD